MPTAAAPALIAQRAGIDQRLQAVSVVSEGVVWVSGLGGRFAWSSDGGEHWTAGVVGGGEELELRDLHAIDAATAFVLAAGPGDRSRIYRTSDGGVSWDLQFMNTDPDAFYDCFAFWDARTGVAFSDSVAGRFPILRTGDGGEHWLLVDPARLPPALAGEGGFAASGTCVVTGKGGRAWIVTGAGERARVLLSEDYGESWMAVDTPIVIGTPTTGLTTLAFASASEGLAAGGDVTAADGRSAQVAMTGDGGRTWKLASPPLLAGAVFGAAYVPGLAGAPPIVVVGPGGANISFDGGESWRELARAPIWSVGFSTSAVGWMVGPAGRITKIVFD